VEYPSEAWSDDEFLPAGVVIFWPGEQSRLSVRLNRIKRLDPPPGVDRFQLKRPPDARRIDLKNPLDPMSFESP
jgi:hypothetical protein